MTCPDAETQLLAARDAPLGAADAAILEQHLQECPGCRRVAAGLNAAIAAWQDRDARAAVPDARREWATVRQRIRKSTTESPIPDGLPSWDRLIRFAAPLAAVLVVAVVFSTRPHEPVAIAHYDWRAFDDTLNPEARAEYVETDNEAVSPVVFVDESSGWLIVWAAEEPDLPST